MLWGSALPGLGSTDHSPCPSLPLPSGTSLQSSPSIQGIRTQCWGSSSPLPPTRSFINPSQPKCHRSQQPVALIQTQPLLGFRRDLRRHSCPKNPGISRPPQSPGQRPMEILYLEDHKVPEGCRELNQKRTPPMDVGYGKVSGIYFWSRGEVGRARTSAPDAAAHEVDTEARVVSRVVTEMADVCR